MNGSKSVYVEDNFKPVINMFLERDYQVVADPSKADFICFTGGEDVMPAVYGHKRHPYTHYDALRDQICTDLYMDYWALPKVGICRGAQFLNVMNGGSLWQHVNNHNLHHGATHIAIDAVTKEKWKVTSTHHQMMIPPLDTQDWELILVADEATTRICTDEFEDNQSKDLKDIEALWFEHSQSLCFQPHPEDVHRDHECQKLFFTLLEQYIGV